MATWVSDYFCDFTAKGNQAAGAAGSKLIDDGKWIDVSGNFASITGGRLKLLCSALQAGGDYLVRDVTQVTPRRSIRVVGRIAPGDAIYNSTGRGIVVGYRDSATCRTVAIGGIQNTNNLWANPEVRSIDPNQGALPGLLANFGSAGNKNIPSAKTWATLTDPTHYYDLEVTYTGHFQRAIEMTVYDMGVSPAALGTTPTPVASTNVSGLVLTDTTQSWTVNQFADMSIKIISGTGAGSYASIASNTSNTITVSSWTGTQPVTGDTYILCVHTYKPSTTQLVYELSNELLNRDLIPGLCGFGSATTFCLYAQLGIWYDSDLQPAYPHCFGNDRTLGGSVRWTAYDFSYNQTLNEYATGGTGSYTYYWHRSSTPSFTPNAGTRISGALSSPAFTDTTRTAATDYYYALETYDGTTTKYTFPGHSLVADQLVKGTKVATTDITLGVFGHSYTAGVGASDSSGNPIAGTNFAAVAARLLNNDAYGVGVRTTTLIRNGNSSSTMIQHTPGVGGLYRQSTQRMAMGGAEHIAVMLSTNDASVTAWTSAAIKSFWKDFQAGLASGIGSTFKKLYIVAAPPLPSGTVSMTLANAKKFLAAQLQAVDQKVSFVVGSGLVDEWNVLNTSNYTTAVPATAIGKVTSGASTTTLTDSSKAWTVNQWAGYTVKFTVGTGATQTATIASNTATALTFSAVTTAPDTTTGYMINTVTFTNFLNNQTSASRFIDTILSYFGYCPPFSPPFISDLIHPNDWGHFQLAQAVAESVLELENTGPVYPNFNTIG